MTSKEKGAAKMLLAMNAVKFLALGEPPISSSMKIAPADMMGCMMATRSGDPKAMCAGGIVAYYMNAESGANSSAIVSWKISCSATICFVIFCLLLQTDIMLMEILSRRHV